MSYVALSVEHVSKSFDTKRVLDDVSFELPEGRIGGLIGPNGAGKTTLFSIMAGFLQPDHGRVKYFGQSLNDIPHLNGMLSILPQDAQFQRSISIERQFFWYAQSMGFDRAEARRELRRVLDWVGLAKEVMHVSDELSNGMNKRMAIAQALIGSPRVILLDEPTAGLDPANARRIRDLIRGLGGKRTLLVSSHNLDEIADVCDYIIIIDGGKILRTGAPHTLIKQSPRLRFKLTIPLDDDGEASLSQLRTLDHVEEVSISDDRRVLSCELHQRFLEDPEPLCALLRLLSQRGLDFTSMDKGAKLEEAFLELTGQQRV